MDKFNPNSLKASGPLSKALLSKGITSFDAAVSYIKYLPYGRNSNRSDYNLIIREGKGTCSTKHAFLKQLAIENGLEDLELCIGIYKMNSANTKGIGKVLESHDLTYIPEAHCYLKFGEKRLDYTNENSDSLKFEEDILYEEIIAPEQIGAYKVDLHQAFLKQWIKANAIPYSFEEIWTIREQCIANLSA